MTASAKTLTFRENIVNRMGIMKLTASASSLALAYLAYSLT